MRLIDLQKTLIIFQATVEWFKIYKMPDGKPANEFAFNGEPKNKEFAEKIIAGTHESWQKLMSGASETGGLSITNTSLSNTASVDQEKANTIISEVRIKIYTDMLAIHAYNISTFFEYFNIDIRHTVTNAMSGSVNC